MHKDLINYLKQIGIAEQILQDLLSDEIFSKLSKHDKYWECEDENDDRLHDIRFKFLYFQDKIMDAISNLDCTSSDYDKEFYGDN